MVLLIPININHNNIYIREAVKTYRLSYITNNINITGIPFKLNNCNIISKFIDFHLYSHDLIKLKLIDKYICNNIPNYVPFIRQKQNDIYIRFVENQYTQQFINKKNFSCYILIKYVKKNKKNIPVIHIIHGE